MSEINPFTPKPEDGPTESNVFLDLNQPDDATGVPAVMPGATGGGGGGSSLMGAQDSSKFNGQVLLAGVVFAIGVGSIYAMRYIGMQAGIKESVTMVEYTASTTSPDFVQRFDTVMDDLEDVSICVQFDRSTVLPSSPFTLASEDVIEDEPVQYAGTPVDPSARLARLARERAENEARQREEQIEEYDFLAKKLVVQSVIGGTRPVARISGEAVGVGMMIVDTFKVVSIKGSVVTLEVDGLRYEVGLGSEAVRVD